MWWLFVGDYFFCCVAVLPGLGLIGVVLGVCVFVMVLYLVSLCFDE